MKKALISVSNKTGLLDFVKQLITFNYEVISTGGTYKLLHDNGIPVKMIDEVTRFPEIMDGRVKTLHPKVHGGLLCLRNNENHLKQAQENQIDMIDMVVVNLYPFKETVAKENVTLAEAIENIDIGGPSMLRSAAKNHLFVTVICDAADYPRVIEELKNNGDTTFETRQQLAAKVFRHTAAYDATIAGYLTENLGETEPENLTLTFSKKQSLRYGENPHQKACFYAGKPQGFSMAFAQQLHGKELSYNNIQDGDAALNMVKEFADEPVMVAVKHKNPCGVGIGKEVQEAWQRCYDADPVSIFGGIVATNQTIDEPTAEAMKNVFLEIILAPKFTDKALEILTAKKNLRLMTFELSRKNEDKNVMLSVNGGLLVQETDHATVQDYEFNVVTEKAPTESEMNDLLFAMKICKHVKSNAITLAKEMRTVGVGAGQMNRVGAAHIALEQAKAAGFTKGIVLASDAFFPFDDVVRIAHRFGVSAIIQPGGSVRDEDSIKACNELGISMVFTGKRHFRH
ncbi:MAG: bifunctional phosphoribosylaminoimidazolecarboxamide formyltransferase/IMP cyclohydrolase [Bacteroidales bacterium]|jgi:phosphoribosylaminoimidazolecarboxamide formyltransferase/IMP cyclohydrolase|nr:bifunctional phosphoribosylaminoimidazolecarboxamide formyltransferase/IMP cyclohydrolase [Bacteroidales bacterium]